MKVEVCIKQSEVRVRSGIKLVLFFAIITCVAWILNITWLAKILICFVLFFSVVTLVECWNAWRLKKKL